MSGPDEILVSMATWFTADLHLGHSNIISYCGRQFAEILQGSKKIQIGRAKAVLCHFPYRGDSHDHDRFVHHRPIDTGAWLLHGHVHERWAQNGRMINVGVDANEFRPIHEATIAELIGAGPESRSPAIRQVSRHLG